MQISNLCFLCITAVSLSLQCYSENIYLQHLSSLCQNPDFHTKNDSFLIPIRKKNHKKASKQPDSILAPNCDPVGTKVIWEHSSICGRCLVKVRDKVSFQKESGPVDDRGCFGGKECKCPLIHPLVLTNKHTYSKRPLLQQLIPPRMAFPYLTGLWESPPRRIQVHWKTTINVGIGASGACYSYISRASHQDLLYFWITR